MPTLTAPADARAAAVDRGLVLPTEPGTMASPKPKISDKKRAWLEQQRIAREHLWPLLSGVFPEVFCLPPVPLAMGSIGKFSRSPATRLTRPSCRPS